MRRDDRCININYKKILVSILLLAIVLSNSYLLARYYSSVNGSSDANVAKFDVAIDTSDNISDSLSVVSGNNTADYIVKVTSNSEVATNYSIELTGVPDGLEVMLDDSGNYVTPVNNRIIFSGNDCVNCSFSANDLHSVHTHILIFNDPITTNNSGANQITINVNFDQKD